MGNSRNPDEQSAHTEGSNDIRQKLIQRFVEHNSGKFDEIMGRLEAGDISSAHRLAHTLKSNAGQLELAALQKAAETIERQLKDGENLVTPEQAALLKTTLEEAFAKLAPLVDRPAPSAPAEPLDRKAAQELLKKVELLLEDYDTGCMSCIDSLRLIPGSEDLIRRMENFSFDEALTAALALEAQL